MLKVPSIKYLLLPVSTWVTANFSIKKEKRPFLINGTISECRTFYLHGVGGSPITGTKEQMFPLMLSISTFHSTMLGMAVPASNSMELQQNQMYGFSKPNWQWLTDVR